LKKGGEAEEVHVGSDYCHDERQGTRGKEGYRNHLTDNQTKKDIGREEKNGSKGEEWRDRKATAGWVNEKRRGKQFRERGKKNAILHFCQRNGSIAGRVRPKGKGRKTKLKRTSVQRKAMTQTQQLIRRLRRKKGGNRGKATFLKVPG